MGEVQQKTVRVRATNTNTTYSFARAQIMFLGTALPHWFGVREGFNDGGHFWHVQSVVLAWKAVCLAPFYPFDNLGLEVRDTPTPSMSLWWRTTTSSNIPRVRLVRVKVEVQEKEEAKVGTVRAKVKRSLPKGSTLTKLVISVA